MSFTTARLISVRLHVYDQLKVLKKSEGLTFSELLERFLTLYGSPSTSESIRPYGWQDK